MEEEEEVTETSLFGHTISPKFGSQALSFITALAIPRSVALLDLGKQKLLLFKEFLSREGDESSIGAFWNWGSDVCTTVPFHLVTRCSIQDVVEENDPISKTAASFSKGEAENSNPCSRLLSEAATYSTCEVAMENSESYSTSLVEFESEKVAPTSEETIQDFNASKDSLLEVQSKSLASSSNAMSNDSIVCTITPVSNVAASISEGAILNSEVCSSDVSESVMKLGTLPSDLVNHISDVTSCDLIESVSNSQAPAYDISIEKSGITGRKKKVRFSPDVVEPSGDSREYRRRITAALIMGIKMASNERSSVQEHGGMTRNLGSFLTRDANCSEIASNPLYVAGTNSFQTHHQHHLQSFSLNEVEAFPNRKSSTGDENWVEFAVCSQNDGQLSTSTDLKPISDEIYTEISLNPSAADSGYNKKINSSPQGTHQWRVQTFATPRLPLNKMSVYNVVQHYSS
eukprot:c28107_g2_i1 orf=309-1685(-)